MIRFFIKYLDTILTGCYNYCTYTTQEETTTLTSAFYWDYELEKITQAEYDKLTDALYPIRDFIDIDKQNIPKKSQNNSKFKYHSYNGVYYQIHYKKLNIAYLKIKFINDTTFELVYSDYNNNLSAEANNLITIRLMPTSYKITYFND